MSKAPSIETTQLLFQQGIELARSGQKREASRVFRQVVRLDPAHEGAWLYYQQGLVLRNGNNFAEARPAGQSPKPDVTQ
jgi:Flp pilus assembly protein TadD